LPFKCNLQRYTVSESWDKIMRWSRRVDSKNEKLEDVLGATKKVTVMGGGSFGTAAGLYNLNPVDPVA
jgi:hypothetical protein